MLIIFRRDTKKELDENDYSFDHLTLVLSLCEIQKS